MDRTPGFPAAATPDFLKEFETSGALFTGHFRLSSGLHSDRYLQCARVLENPARAARLCTALAAKCRESGAETVVAPALGGILVGYELARALEIRSLFAERVEGTFRLRRGFAVRRGERVLLAEDVITTGGSLVELAEGLAPTGVAVVGAVCLVDRGGAAALPWPVWSLVEVRPPTWTEADCPMCRDGIPLDTPGSRRLQ